ncbi:MAG: hypothetical protein KAR38_05220 [Calditrichia bacterium]|nr:hypothetical protein [Calditrichia bacterium]
MKKFSYIVFVLFTTLLYSSDNHTIKKSILKENIKEVKVKISFSKGECLLKTADLGDNLFEGSLYFAKERPAVTFNKKGEMAVLEILSESDDYDFSDSKNDKNKSIQINPFSMSGENKWDITLSSDVIFAIDISTGGSKNIFNFDEAKIQYLKMEIGAAKSFITFNEPNSVEMEELVINGGASKIECNKLANSRAKSINVETGVGSCKLDFSGKLQNNITIEISNGVGLIDLLIPEDAGAMIKVSSSFLSKFICKDYKNISGVYYSKNYSSSKHHLNFFIDNALGTVKVIPVK